MKHTLQCSRTFYNAFKPKVATLVSTLVLAACTAAPTSSLASSVRLPDSSYAKLCFSVTEMLYPIIRISNSDDSVEFYDAVVAPMQEDKKTKVKVKAYLDALDTMYYLGMTKRNFYKSDSLKQVLMIECPNIFREANARYAK